MQPRSQLDPAPQWPESPFDRLDLETAWSVGPEEADPPDGWSWADVERAWYALGAGFRAGEFGPGSYALAEWGGGTPARR